MFTKYKKLILTLIVIIGLFFAYSIFFGKDPEQDSLLRSSVTRDPQTSTDVLGADIMRVINQINSLELDRSVFDNPVLKRLVDRSERIEPEQPGRDNPFAPIGVTRSTTQTRSEQSDDSLETGN